MPALTLPERARVAQPCRAPGVSCTDDGFDHFTRNIVIATKKRKREKERERYRALFNEASVEILEKCLNPYRWWEERGKLSSRRNEAVRGKVTKAKGVHGGSTRPRRDSTEAFTSARSIGGWHDRSHRSQWERRERRFVRSTRGKQMAKYFHPPSYRYGGIGGVGRVFRA